MIRTVIGEEKMLSAIPQDLAEIDYAAIAMRYLLNAGMTEDQISVLKAKVAG